MATTATSSGSQSGSRSGSLISVLWPAGNNALFRNVVLVLLGTVLLALSAKTQVPFYPVPMTMQTFVVLVLGATYGWRLAGATVLVYLLEGAVGLPVFSTGAGLAYLAGPTGGYLIGFLFAAMAVGALAERGFDRKASSALTMFFVGELVIFSFGLVYLASFVGVDKVIMAGLYPFIPGEALKLGLAVALVPLIWRKIGK